MTAGLRASRLGRMVFELVEELDAADVRIAALQREIEGLRSKPYARVDSAENVAADLAEGALAGLARLKWATPVVGAFVHRLVTGWNVQRGEDFESRGNDLIGWVEMVKESER